MKKIFIIKQIFICLFSFISLLFSMWFILSDNVNYNLLYSLNHITCFMIVFSALINGILVGFTFIISFSNIIKYGNDDIFRALKEDE